MGQKLDRNWGGKLTTYALFAAFIISPVRAAEPQGKVDPSVKTDFNRI